MQQANLTKNTMKNLNQFLDYYTTHPDTIVTYRSSNMILAVQINASYISETNARSRVGGEFTHFQWPDPPNNGAILTIAQMIKKIMSSAAEAKMVALYIKFK